MHPLRRPTRSTIHYHGRTREADGLTSVTFSINGVRWEYPLPVQAADTVEYLAHRVSVGKAFAHAKQHCARGGTRLDPLPQATLFARHRGAQASRAKRMKVSLPDV